MVLEPVYGFDLSSWGQKTAFIDGVAERVKLISLMTVMIISKCALHFKTLYKYRMPRFIIVQIAQYINFYFMFACQCILESKSKC